MKLIINIKKAITAAGGFAQVMERQDLEGKVTNSTGKKKEKKEEDKEHEDEKKD